MEATRKIGTLTRIHGLRGELSFSFTDDVWDRVDAEYLFLEVDGIQVPFFLDEYRFRSDTVALLKFVDVDTADEAQEYVGCDVYFPLLLIPDEMPEDLQWSMLVGFKVVQDGSEIGIIKAVDDTTANVLFYIDTPHGEVLVPAVDDFVTYVDYQNSVISMQIPDGLLNLNE